MQDDFFFIHIPKTGGSTIRGILETYFSKYYYKLYHGEIWDQKRIDEMVTSEKPVVVCCHPHECYDAWFELLTRRKLYSFGTMLRNPVARVLSNYYYLLLNSRGEGAREELKSKGYTVVQALDKGLADLVDNLQTKMLAYMGTLVEKNAPCTQEMFELAVHNLSNHMPYIGIVEAYKESIALLSQFLDFEIKKYKKRRVTANKPDYSKIEDDVLQEIRERNSYDLQLYDLARDIFFSRLKNNPMVLERIKELEEFEDEDSLVYR